MSIALRRVAGLAILAYVALVLYLTLILSFSLGPGVKLNLVPFAMIAQDFQSGGRGFYLNFLGNLGVFGPLGFLWPIAMGGRPGFVRVLLGGMALSITIEVIQGLSGHRVADVDDVILNTTGGLIGYGAWLLVASRFRNPVPADQKA